jgi:hypothetical protein
MWPTWSTVPLWWNRVMQVVLVSMLLAVSACSVPGHLLSTPSVQTAIEGRVGPQDSANGNGGM